MHAYIFKDLFHMQKGKHGWLDMCNSWVEQWIDYLDSIHINSEKQDIWMSWSQIFKNWVHGHWWHTPWGSKVNSDLQHGTPASVRKIFHAQETLSSWHLTLVGKFMKNSNWLSIKVHGRHMLYSSKHKINEHSFKKSNISTANTLIYTLIELSILFLYTLNPLHANCEVRWWRKRTYRAGLSGGLGDIEVPRLPWLHHYNSWLIGGFAFHVTSFPFLLTISLL